MPDPNTPFVINSDEAGTSNVIWEGNQETWPLFDCPEICDRIIAAPAWGTPLIWEDGPPDLTGMMIWVCAPCGVTATESDCWVCGEQMKLLGGPFGGPLGSSHATAGSGGGD